MKNIAIFGSTGSIGKNALKVIKAFDNKFKVVGLAVNSNIELLKSQINEFSPEAVAVADTAKARRLSLHFKGSKRPKIFSGKAGLIELAGRKDIDTFIMAIGASSALAPLLAAIDNGRLIALANKEALVMAGKIITERAKLKKAAIIPVDSEHSAVFQCLLGQNQNCLKKIYLTASGGPLRKTASSKMHLVTPKAAMRHPKWVMGKKISVDSATMMNKGLEVIEAKWLFGLQSGQIEVLVHPQAVVHSMVEFIDGSVIAQMGVADMRLPIQYALTYPERLSSGLSGLDFARIKKLDFYRPDFKKFPCLELAYEAASEDGTMPAVLNAANEELVKSYLEGKIKFTDIANGVSRVLKAHRTVKNPSLDEILQADAWARERINTCCPR